MTLAQTLEPFVCGGSAATFASVVIHPMDLAKVRKLLLNMSESSADNLTILPGAHAALWADEPGKASSIIC